MMMMRMMRMMAGTHRSATARMLQTGSAVSEKTASSGCCPAASSSMAQQQVQFALPILMMRTEKMPMMMMMMILTILRLLMIRMTSMTWMMRSVVIVRGTRQATGSHVY